MGLWGLLRFSGGGLRGLFWVLPGYKGFYGGFLGLISRGFRVNEVKPLDLLLGGDYGVSLGSL